MSDQFDPNGGLPPATPGAMQPTHQTPPASYPPYPGAPHPGAPYPGTPYPGAPEPPPGYPAQPQGYPYPYGSYPPPYNPYGYPPPQPPRQSHTALWVTLSIVGIVVIGACVGCSILAGSLFNTASRVAQQYYQPLLVVESFCQDEMDANYSAAYSQLSTSQQASLTRDQFVAQSTARDTSEGTVTDCTVNSSNTNLTSTSSSATIGVMMTRSIAGTFQGTLTLINDDSAWTIDQIDPALPILTDGTPTQGAGTPAAGTATPTV
jgi:hypothetical protein